MGAQVKLEGLAELREALRNLPKDLADEAQAIVEAKAEFAAQQIQRAYPQGPTGNLRRLVSVSREPGAFTARAIVRSRSPHSHLFEYGTRRRKTNRGWNRGAMPPAPSTEAMVPIVVRTRRALVSALIEVVKKAGFEVQA